MGMGMGILQEHSALSSVPSRYICRRGYLRLRFLNTLSRKCPWVGVLRRVLLEWRGKTPSKGSRSLCLIII